MTPSTRLNATPTRPMVSEVRVPYMSRDQRSRPCSSVPRRNRVSSGRAPSTPIRCRVVGSTPSSRYSKPWAKKRTGTFWLGSGV